MTEILHIQNVSKQFKQQPVLDRVNIRLKAGTSYGLIGLNGAGKTTLIKCILDLQRVDSGSIFIEGLSSEKSCARNNLIYLPEKFSPPAYMNGWTYLNFITDAHRDKSTHSDKTKWRKHIEQLCERIDLDFSALKKSTLLFSKGMLQKLGILGCLLSDKSFLILDEPMTGLDPKARISFKEIINSLKEQGKTILICSHVLTDIEKLCSQISILHQGTVRFNGSPQQCCTQTACADLETAFLNIIG